MATLDSNQDDINRALADIVDGWDFTRTGQDQALGRELAVTLAEAIADRSSEGLDPDRRIWLATDPSYTLYKKAKYGVEAPNYRTGQMLSLTSLLGETVVGPDLVEMRYGTGTPPAAALNGTSLTAEDASITDIEKAFFCSKTRAFYAIGSDDPEVLRRKAEDALNLFAGEVWSGGHV